MRWSGTISCGPYPSAGVSLLAEVRQGHGWRTFAEILARAGRFSYHYTFTRTLHATTYLFRMSPPRGGSGGYNYLPASSATVRVRVG
jgi:hypothetical protein